MYLNFCWNVNDVPHGWKRVSVYLMCLDIFLCWCLDFALHWIVEERLEGKGHYPLWWWGLCFVWWFDLQHKSFGFCCVNPKLIGPHPWLRPSPGGGLKLTCRSLPLFPSWDSCTLSTKHSILNNTPRLGLTHVTFPHILYPNRQPYVSHPLVVSSSLLSDSHPFK